MKFYTIHISWNVKSYQNVRLTLAIKNLTIIVKNIAVRHSLDILQSSEFLKDNKISTDKAKKIQGLREINMNIISFYINNHEICHSHIDFSFNLVFCWNKRVRPLTIS